MEKRDVIGLFVMWMGSHFMSIGLIQPLEVPLINGLNITGMVMFVVGAILARGQGWALMLMAGSGTAYFAHFGDTGDYAVLLPGIIGAIVLAVKIWRSTD